MNTENQPPAPPAPPAPTASPTELDAPSSNGGANVVSIRDKILSARKAPEEVARLMKSKTLQLTIPVFKRPKDGFFWQVRGGQDWDPHNNEFLLLPRKDCGGGPEFLLVLPELEQLFNSDPRLCDLVRYHHLAFVMNAGGHFGWWAIPSRSENDWHVSARNMMRELTGKWGMIKTNTPNKCYDLEEPDDKLDDPQWPSGSFEDWYLKGMSDKVIDSPDHPVLLKLQGRKK